MAATQGDMRVKKSAVSVLSLVLLAACSVGDDYVRPEAKPPEQWKNPGIAAAPPA